MSEYEDRDITYLDEQGGHYCRHVQAMTAEGLHSKSDIAAELGWRDRRIGHLQAKIDMLMLEYCPDEMTPEQLKEWESHQVPRSIQEKT